MNLSKHKSKISLDFRIMRTLKGVILVEPESSYASIGSCALSQIFALPLNFFIINRQSKLIQANDTAITTCGYSTQKEALGKTVKNIANSQTAQAVIANDRAVIQARQVKVFDESLKRSDDQTLSALSFKFPWLDLNQQVQGVFGCSILTNVNDYLPLTECLAILMQTGLLNCAEGDNFSLPGRYLHGVYFSKQEVLMLHLLVRGKTAKDIGKLMGSSHRTIEHRIEKIRSRLQVKSKAELIEKIFDKFK